MRCSRSTSGKSTYYISYAHLNRIDSAFSCGAFIVVLSSLIVHWSLLPHPSGVRDLRASSAADWEAFPPEAVAGDAARLALAALGAEGDAVLVEGDEAMDEDQAMDEGHEGEMRYMGDMGEGDPVSGRVGERREMEEGEEGEEGEHGAGDGPRKRARKASWVRIANKSLSVMTVLLLQSGYYLPEMSSTTVNDT